jgi:glycosyltransferase involved in cell wall biosynthesis
VPESKISVVPDGVPVLPVSTRSGGVLALANKMPPGVECRFSSDLERDLLDASVFVYCTECEGLGSAVLMAMSAGVPVVASNVGGLCEIVRDGENGLLVENTKAGFEAAIRRLGENPERTAQIAEAARETIVHGFTVDHMVRRTMEIYHQVIQ